MLSFIIHSLLTTPDAYVKLRAEVDSVIGERVVTLADIAKMPYMTGMLAQNLGLLMLTLSFSRDP